MTMIWSSTECMFASLELASAIWMFDVNQWESRHINLSGLLYILSEVCWNYPNLLCQHLHLSSFVPTSSAMAMFLVYFTPMEPTTLACLWNQAEWKPYQINIHVIFFNTYTCNKKTIFDVYHFKQHVQMLVVHSHKLYDEFDLEL